MSGNLGVSEKPEMPVNNPNLWLAVSIYAEGCTLGIRNASTDWGQFHVCGDRMARRYPDEINKTIIRSGEHVTICASGGQSGFAGTNGFFDVFDGGNHVGKYHWDCPAGKPSNESVWEPDNTGYDSTFSPGELHHGSIGNVTIKITKK